MLRAFLSSGGATTDFALIIVLLFTVWQLYRGYCRGFKRQLVHTAFMAFAAILAYSIAGNIADAFISELQSVNVADLIMELKAEAPDVAIPDDLIQTLTAMDLGILAYALSMPLALIVPPIIFLILFIILSMLANIACSIVLLFLGILLGEKGDRNLGLAVGAIEGFAIAVVMLLPIAGFSGLIADTAETFTVADDAINDGEPIDFGYTESGTVSILRRVGGDATMRKFSAVTIEGEKYYITDEYRNILGLISEAPELIHVNFSELSETDKSAIDGALDHIYDSRYLTNLCYAGLQLLGDAVTGTEPLFEVGSEYQGLISAMAGVFASGSAETFEEDIETLKEAYYIISDSGILTALNNIDELSKAMTATDEEGKTAVSRVTALLNKNDRTRPIVTELTKLSLKLMASGDSIVTEELYENVKTGVTDTLAIDKDSFETPEEYKEAITESLDTTLKENNIELAPDVVADIADYIDENYEDLKDATDEQINEIILSYHDAYIEYLKSQESAPEEQ